LPSVSAAGQSFSSLTWPFKFPRFVLEVISVNWSWSKQNLIFKEWLHLCAYECVIIQFVSVFITAHIYTLSSVFLLLHSVLRDITLLYSKCARKFWQGLYIWALWFRFYDLLHGALWVKKTTISAFINSLKASFLLKIKPFLCLLLLLICVTSAPLHTYTHTRARMHVHAQNLSLSLSLSLSLFLQKMWFWLPIQNDRDILKTSLW
jgi:hypothetical protein